MSVEYFVKHNKTLFFPRIEVEILASCQLKNMVVIKSHKSNGDFPKMLEKSKIAIKENAER